MMTMKPIRLIAVLLIYNTIIVKSQTATENNNNGKTLSSVVFTNITDHIGILFNSVFNSLGSQYPDNLCYDYLKQYYQYGAKDRLALTKLVFDSSKNKNDVGTSSKCRNNDYSFTPSPLTFDPSQVIERDLSLKDFTYLIIQTTSVNSSLTNHYGICFISSELCTKIDYINLVHSVNNYTNVFYPITQPSPLSASTTLSKSSTSSSLRWNVNLFNMKETELNNQFKPIDLAKMIPLFIILIICLFSVFPAIPTFLFQNCFKSQKSVALDNSRSSKSRLLENTTRLSERSIVVEQSSINKKYLCRFKSCFSLGENGEELFNIKNESTDFSNESGLSYIKGMRGVSMIFVLFGAIFSSLYNHPSRIIGDDGRTVLYESFFYSFVIFGERTAYSILFSCSGYCLAYKLICYLDDKLVDQSDHDNDHDGSGSGNGYFGNKTECEDLFDFQKADRPSQGLEQLQSLNEIFTMKHKENKEDSIQMQKIISRGEAIDQSSLLDDKDPITITWFYFFRFILYQLPKYILVLSTFFIGKYSLNPIMNIIVNVGPMFEILKQRMIDDFNLQNILSHIFIIQIDYTTIYTVLLSNNPKGSILEVIWMPLNEIEFFVCSALLIFICFKRQYRLDFICLIIASILVLIKIIITITISHLKPSEYYYNYPYYYFSFLPSCNYQYYLIGILFGMINYAIQKETSFRDVLKRKKPYLLSIVSIVTFLKKRRLSKSSGLLILIIIALVLLFIFYFYSTLHFCGVTRENIKLITNFFYLIDSEVFVVLTHVFVLLCYLRGENMIYSFLSSSNWGVFNKIYFFFILTCEPLIMLIFYQSETRINVNYFSVLFYGLICGFIIFVLSTLTYIFLGIPYKRIIKLIYHLKEKSLMKSRKKQ